MNRADRRCECLDRALDPGDPFHDTSIRFLRVVSRSGLSLHDPVFILLEVACAMARRTGSETVAVAARSHLESHPELTLHPIDEPCLKAAHDLGVRQFLRGADALYAATAFLSGARLVSWDEELVQRAGGLTPESWLNETA